MEKHFQLGLALQNLNFNVCSWLKPWAIRGPTSQANSLKPELARLTHLLVAVIDSSSPIGAPWGPIAEICLETLPQPRLQHWICCSRNRNNYDHATLSVRPSIHVIQKFKCSSAKARIITSTLTACNMNMQSE